MTASRAGLDSFHSRLSYHTQAVDKQTISDNLPKKISTTLSCCLLSLL
jgi:hypothetical protein